MKNKKKKSLQIAAFLLSAVMVGTELLPGVMVAEAKEKGQTEASAAKESEQTAETIAIKSIEDLQKLSEYCINDAYSKGKIFTLEADLDARGVRLKPIAIFCGTLEGNGHRISGLTMRETGSDLGLIRFLEKEGTVRNLTVEGLIQPGGTSKNIGGIVGTNRGVLENCFFEGEVIAKENVGGLAGYNEEGGVISGCHNKGKLLGTKKTGGIVGNNEGTVENCTNEGGVNATAETVSGANKEETASLNFSFSLDLDEMSKDEERITSTGGIAGVSNGMINNCINRGMIGYQHVGYRTGGIVGYQRGCVNDCQNNGKVQGRKDTGGIAGLFEPYVEINYEEGTAKKLRTQTDALSDMFSNLSDIAKDADRDTLDNMDAVGDSIDGLKDSIDHYKDYYQDQADAFIDDMEEALDIVERRIDMLDFDVDDDKALDTIRDMKKDGEEVKKILEALKKLQDIDFGDLGNAGANGGKPDTTSDKPADETQDTTSDKTQDKTPDGTQDKPSDETQDKAPDKTPDKISDDTSDNTQDDTVSEMEVSGNEVVYTIMTDPLNAPADDAAQGDAAPDGANPDGANPDGANPDGPSADKPNPGLQLPPQVIEAMKQLGISEEKLVQILIEAGWDGKPETLNTAIQKAIQNIAQDKVLGLAKKMEKRSEQLGDLTEDVVGEGKSLIDNLDKLGTEIKHVIHVAENHTKSLRDDLKETDKDISAQTDVLGDKIDDLKDRLRDANDDVIAQMDEITDQMRLINDTVSDGMDKLEDKLNEADEKKKFSDYFDDLSDSENTADEKGKVMNSRNTGEIISDINGGGIAGSISVDLLDGESEFSIEKVGSRTMDAKRTARGTIYNCKNNNEVNVKNDYAGGIVGRADMGAVVACQNYGDVTTKDGDYAGGIAGRSDFMIRNSYTLSNINGNSYAGGIAGEAKNIQSSYAMTSIFTETGEKFGAIAGDADGELVDNYFVDDGIAAVDGLTYASQAAPLSYEQLIEMENIPEDFSRFTIKFMADDEEVKSIVCGYGDSLKEKDIPMPPEKDGILGTWDKNDFSNIRRNMIVRAVYGNWTTAIASGEETPAVLISGRFLPNVALKCTKLSETDVNAPLGYQVLSAYQYQITDASLLEENTFGIHLLTKDYRGKFCAAVWKDGKAELVKGRQDGQYYVFEVNSGREGTVVLLAKEQNMKAVFAAIGAAALLVLGLLLRKIHKRKKAAVSKKSAKEERKEAEKLTKQETEQTADSEEETVTK